MGFAKELVSVQTSGKMPGALWDGTIKIYKFLTLPNRIDWTNGSQSVVPGPAALVSPGNLLAMCISGPARCLVNQKLEGGKGCEQGREINLCFNKVTGASQLWEPVY